MFLLWQLSTSVVTQSVLMHFILYFIYLFKVYLNETAHSYNHAVNAPEVAKRLFCICSPWRDRDTIKTGNRKFENIKTHHDLKLLIPSLHSRVCHRSPCYSGWIPDPLLLLRPWWPALRPCGDCLRGAGGRLAQGTSSTTWICGSSRGCSEQQGTRMRSRGPRSFGATEMRLNSPRPW